MTDAYERIYWRGVVLNRRTAAMMDEAQRKFGRPFGSIPQGSYHAGTSQSAGTHDGGGAVDIYDSDPEGVDWAMRCVGFASNVRWALAGVWSTHVHAIAIGDVEAASLAKLQVKAYLARYDGLGYINPTTGVSQARDYSRRPDPIPVFKYGQEPEDEVTPDDFEKIASIVENKMEPVRAALSEFRENERGRDVEMDELVRRVLAAARNDGEPAGPVESKR